jgi:hypothetical protein
MLGEDGEGVSERRPAERSDVIAVLREHGISGTVAAALWTVARDLRTRTRRRGFEHASTLDVADGGPVGETITGYASGADLTPHLVSMQVGHHYIQIHTHPRNTSFSDVDMRLFVERPALKAMIVVGVDGSWHVLSRPAGIRLTDPRAVFYDFVGELQRLTQSQVNASERPHRATEHIAASYDLLYDRVTGLTDERTPP